MTKVAALPQHLAVASSAKDSKERAVEWSMMRLCGRDTLGLLIFETCSSAKVWGTIMHINLGLFSINVM